MRPFSERERKRQWAMRNADKVREANRRWRAANESKCRRQARARMQRFRARQRKIPAAAVT